MTTEEQILDELISLGLQADVLIWLVSALIGLYLVHLIIRWGL